jgi:hypothetical protein
MGMRNLLATFLAVLAVMQVASASAYWRPAVADSFDWQYGEPIRLTGQTTTINLDTFDTDRHVLKNLRAQGICPICCVNVGAWEDWRPDRKRFPADTLGKNYVGWKGERWLGVRRLDLLMPIMKARFRLCRNKGFAAIEPDNLDGFENDTGFSISHADQIRCNRAIAAEAHALGMASVLKNTPSLVADLVNDYDFAILEDCFKWKWCDQFAPFVAQNKVLVSNEYAEDGRNPLIHCKSAKRLGIQIAVKRRNLDSWSKRCR